jgi:hypothetical protein
MRTNLAKILFTLLMAAPLSSWALFEARLTYGSSTSTQDLANLCQGSCVAPSTAPGIVPTFGIGADAIVKLPLIPIGFGVRYEDMKLSASSSTISGDINFKRTALLLNYRFIDTIVHFGPIVSVGLSQKGNITLKEGGTTRVDVSSDSAPSYSVGLELGVKPLIVVPISVGAELGYMSYKWGQVTNTIDGTQKDVDLSGTYLKVFLGFDI